MKRGALIASLLVLVASCSARHGLVPSAQPLPGAVAGSPAAHQNPTPTPTPSPSPTPVHHSTAPKPSPRTTPTHRSTAICSGARTPSRWDHVIWIWMENHSYEQVIGYSGAPYENALADKCGLATNYHGVAHPSLPNYIAATGGTTAGISDDCSPSSSCESTGPSIFEQVPSWRAYQESMPSNCAMTSSGEYAVKHNPAPYYTRIRSACQSRDVPFGSTSSGRFVTDLANDRLPAFSFITPNLCNDTHDCSVPTGDAWLRSVVGRITGSPTYRAGRTAIFITWDEGYDSSNRVPTIVVAPTVRKHERSGTSFDHYSLLRTAEEMLGVPLLGNAQAAVSMRNAFGL